MHIDNFLFSKIIKSCRVAFYKGLLREGIGNRQSILFGLIYIIPPIAYSIYTNP